MSRFKNLKEFEKFLEEQLSGGGTGAKTADAAELLKRAALRRQQIEGGKRPPPK